MAIFSSEARQARREERGERSNLKAAARELARACGVADPHAVYNKDSPILIFSVTEGSMPGCKHDRIVACERIADALTGVGIDLKENPVQEGHEGASVSIWIAANGGPEALTAKISEATRELRPAKSHAATEVARRAAPPGEDRAR